MPALIIHTIALQLILKIIRLSYQASLRRAGLALFWKTCFNDLVKPLENIDLDRIVGIRCDFNEKSPFFILSVYMPASSHCTARNLMNTLTISGHYTIHYPLKAL